MPTKFISGFFYDRDFRYNSLKGDFFNKVKETLGLSEPIGLLTVGNIDILKVADRPEFEFRMTDQNFNYEDVYSSQVKHIEDSLMLGQYWEEATGRLYRKIGGVLQFDVTGAEQGAIDFIFRYYRNIIDRTKVKSSKLHLNFSETLENREYNINLTVQASREPEKISGILDINRDVAEGMKSVEARLILDQLFSYFEDQLRTFIGEV